jgi:hypothetical protein
MTSARIFDLLLLASLAALLCLGLARALLLARRGVRVLALDRERSLAQGLGDLAQGLLLLFWVFEVVACTWPLPLRSAAPRLGAVLVGSLWVKAAGTLLLLAGLALYGLALAALGASWRLGIDRDTPGPLVTGGVDDAHAMCVGWLANRHALIALVFGVFALLAHLRWRRSGAPAWFAAAAASLTVALLCGEGGLGAAAYIVAWELAMEDAPWPRRAAALLPYVLLVAGWRAVYEQLGYGTTGSPLYVDPGHQPIAFLAALVERWPILQLTQWLQVPVDLFILLPRSAQIALALAAAAACAALLWLLAPLCAASRTARFWAAGMCLALVPLCAAFPMDRLLLFSAVGAFALLALLAEQAGLLARGAALSGRARRLLAALLLILHGPLAAALLAGRIATLPHLGVLFELGALTAPADERAPRQTFVFVNGHEFPVVYLPSIRQLQSPAVSPRRVALLASMLNDNEVRREGEATLAIRARGGFLQAPVDCLLRSLETPFRVGERIERRDFTAEIRSLTADGRPAEVAFHFRLPLEASELRWLAWDETGVRPFALPPVGARVELPAVGVLPFLAGRGWK